MLIRLHECATLKKLLVTVEMSTGILEGNLAMCDSTQSHQYVPLLGLLEMWLQSAVRKRILREEVLPVIPCETGKKKKSNNLDI